MSGPAPSSAVYGDFAALEKLKANVRQQDPTALAQVARQFEAVFARMMIKSMRKAVGPDPIFGSDQAQMYQGLFDDQLSLELTRGRGLGLAQMLMHQLQQTGSASTTGTITPSTLVPSAQAAPASDPAAQERFVQTHWPAAQQAAQQLGVNPENVLAQAALESNWGRNVPRDAQGSSSHNLFGIKASPGSEHSVSADTVEFQSGAATSVRDAFRSYADPAASFNDYVALLQGNPRYRDALRAGTDAHAFGAALQRGGYATDPAYAQKVARVAQQVMTYLATPGTTSIKSDEARPITSATAAL